METSSYELDPQTLQLWLEWAGSKLVALKGQKIKPSQYNVHWPEYSQDRFEILNFRPSPSIRISGPSKDEIPLMDEILLLPNLSGNIFRRRVLHARSVMHPFSGRHLYSWQRIARLIEKDPRTARKLHELGLKEVAKKVPYDQVCRIASALAASIQSLALRA